MEARLSSNGVCKTEKDIQELVAAKLTDPRDAGLADQINRKWRAIGRKAAAGTFTGAKY